MPYTHATPFGTTSGNLSDEERLRAQVGQSQAGIAAQMQALQAEIADRQAGRQFQGDQATQDRTFQGGMFDKNAGLQKDLDASATARALGITHEQMSAANATAALERDKWMAGDPQRQLQAFIIKQQMERAGALPPSVGSAAPVARAPGMTPVGGFGGDTSVKPAPTIPAAPAASDDDGFDMAMALSNNPAEVYGQRLAAKRASQTHDDYEDAETGRMIDLLAKNGSPQAMALIPAMMAARKNNPFKGIPADQLIAGLRPMKTADDVLKSNPALQMKLDNVKTLLSDASRIGGSKDQVDRAGQLMVELIKDLTDQGMKPEDAKAKVAMELKAVLPGNTPIMNGVMNFLTGGISGTVAGPANDRTAQARTTAGLVD